MYRTKQPHSTTDRAPIGLAVALVALVGIQFFGWKWGGGQLVPAIIGVAAAAIAVVVIVNRLG